MALGISPLFPPSCYKLRTRYNKRNLDSNRLFKFLTSATALASLADVLLARHAFLPKVRRETLDEAPGRLPLLRLVGFFDMLRSFSKKRSI